jgi:glycosyltransferase involved in cell wall biosynthesis
VAPAADGGKGLPPYVGWRRSAFPCRRGETAVIPETAERLSGIHTAPGVTHAGWCPSLAPMGSGIRPQAATSNHQHGYLLKVVLFANTEWYLYNFRRSLAAALRASGHEVLLVSPPGPYGEKLRELGYRWLPAPMQRRSLNPLRELALVWWLRRLFRREHVDLVHGFTIKSAVYGALAARLGGVPAQVSSVAGLGYVFISDDTKARVLRPLVRLALRLTLGGRSARLILQNPDDAAMFHQARLVHPDAIRLIAGSGVDCERFTPAGDVDDVAEGSPAAEADRERGQHPVAGRPAEGSAVGEANRERSHRPVVGRPAEESAAAEAGRERSKSPVPGRPADDSRAGQVFRTYAARFRVLLPARLLWDKGLAEYVEAARLLRAEGRAVDFLLAGDPDPGNPASVPEATVAAWVREGLVQWLGHVDDMPALFRSVDAVVLPSYREGLPKGLIEAAACGLPLVTTDVPGCREVVTHGVDGLLVPVRDAGALAAAIARLQDSRALRASLGQAARARALAEYDERIVIQRTLAVYEELLPDLATP